MAIERVDSLFDIPAIQQEFSAVKTGLADSQKALVDLYSQVKGFKDTNITTLASNTQKLMDSINGSTQATARAAQNYDALTKKIAEQVAASRSNTDAIAGQAQAYDQLIKQSVRNKLGLDELAKSAKEVKAAFDKGETTLDQYTASLESIKGAQQTLKTSNQDITKSLNNLEKQAQSSGTSVDGLRAKLNLLTQAYDKLSEEERASEGGQTLLKNIQDTDAAYKKLKEDSGRFQDSVGNYKGAFQEAFKVLKDELSQVNKQMGDLETKGAAVVNNLTGGGKIGFDPNRHKGEVTSFAKTGGESVNIAAGDTGVYDQLFQKREILNKLTQQTTIGFKTSRQEARAFQEAAVQLGLAIGQTDEKFLEFNKAVGEVQNGINDIKAATKFQAQDAKLFVGLVSAVNGLVGAFGAAQAAAGLLSDESEETQKQMQKLQQLLVLITGLQQVANTVQEESGAVQLVLAAKTGLLSAARRIQTLVTTQAIAVVTADTIANEANATSQEEVAATSAEATVAMEAEAVAATEGAAATTAFSAAFIAGGLGVVILAAAAAVVYLVSKIPGWIQGTQLTMKQQEALADALKDANQAIIEQSEFIDKLDQSTQNYYKNQLGLSQAAGQNQYKQYALEKALAQSQHDAAEQRIKDLGATNAQQAALSSSIQRLTGEWNEYNKILLRLNAIPTKDLTSDDKRQIEAAEKNKQLVQKRIDSVKGLYDAGEKARQDSYAATQKQGQLDLQLQKFTADEERKIEFESSRARIEAIKDRNQKILADDASTLKMRLTSLRAIRDQEKTSAQNDFNNVNNDPNATIRQIEVAQIQLNAARGKADRDYLQATDKLKREYYERDRDAALEIFKDEQEGKIRIAKDLQEGKINNPNPLQANEVPLDKRLKGLSDEYTARRDMLNAELKAELDKEGQTQEEKLAIYAKYANNIDLLNRDLQKSRLDLEKQAQEASLRRWDLYYSRRKNQVESESADAIKGLNERSIGDKEYSRQRQKIEDDAAIQRAQLEAQNAEVQRNATKDGTQARLDADAKLVQSALDLSDKIKKAKDDGANATRERVEEGVKEIEMIGDAAISVLDIGYNIQKVHLEELEARQQKAYENNVKNINDSSATEEQKAIRLKILDDQRAVQKEQNDRKQRQLDIQKAQFDKANAIMHIILNTAVAVMQAGANLPLAIAVGLEGAAQLAAAIATPLPHYKEGTLDHPGGAAVTGDGGVKELILEPGRPARWSQDRPTLEKLMPHTKVIPPHKIDEWLMAGMFVNPQGALVEMKQPDIKQELRDIKDAIVWAAQEQREVAKANRPRIVNKITVNAGWNTYVQNSVFK
jgi:hypothetical protein